MTDSEIKQDLDNAESDYLVVGKMGSTYGVQGWLKILSYTEKVNNILGFDPWYIEDGVNWKAVHIEESREHGKGIIVKFAGLNNPETARLWSGKKIAILRSQLPALPKNEYYWSDLKNLTVIDQHGKTLGKIIYLIETGSNDVLVVKGDKEYAIPYLPGRVVKDINLDDGVMHVDWEAI